MNQKTIIAILVVLIIILLGTTIFFAKNQNQSPKSSSVAQQPAQFPQQNSTPTQINNALKTYQNQKYGFSLSYPANYKIQETNWEQEPQPGGTIYVVQFGDETVVDFETDFDKGIMIYVAKIEKGMRNGEDPLAEPNGMEPISQKDTIIDGQKARIYNNGEVYTVAKNGYEYLMILGRETNQATKDNFSKIVSSFKFIK